jgi:hypothetical protein
MSEKESKKLLHRISVLEKQNSKLKKQLIQYRKYVDKSAGIILDNYEMYQELEMEEENKKIKKCDNCGKGDLKKIKILDFSFEICGLCNYRKKIK